MRRRFRFPFPFSARWLAAIALFSSLGPSACGSESTGQAPAASETTCVDGEWCWVRGRPLSLVGDRARGEITAIGAEGAFFRWSGRAWEARAVPTRHTLVTAFSGSPRHACAGDDEGNAFHFDGEAWRREDTTGPVQKMLGGDDGSCWAIVGGSAAPHGGSSGARLVHRGDDGVWVQPAPVHPYCLGGDYLVVDDVPWSAGLTCDATGAVENVEVRRFVDGTWQLVGAPLADQSWYPSLGRVDGRPSVSATGSFVWDGTIWTRRKSPDFPQQTPAGHTPLGDDLGYVMAPVALRCEAAYHLAPEDALCVGAGQIYRQGAIWQATLDDPLAGTGAAGLWGEVPPTLWAGSDTIHAWGSSEQDVYRARRSTQGALEHFDGSRWESQGIEGVQDIAGGGVGDVWLATADGPRHLENGAFVRRPLPEGQVLRVHALGEGSAAAITREAVFVTDQTGSWSRSYEAPKGWELRSIAGKSASDLWIVETATGRSNDARLQHFSGAFWQVHGSDITALGGELHTAAGETWLANDSLVARLDGTPLVISLGDRWLADQRTLWVDARAIWLTTPTQARRHGR